MRDEENVNAIHSTTTKIDVSNKPMDSRTLSSVIQTLSQLKFSGALNESVDLMITMFNLACSKFYVPEKEKLDLLTYALTGPARQHYLTNRPSLKYFIGASSLLKRTYNCASRQLQVVRLLEQLRYRKFSADIDMHDPAEGLKLLVEYIESLIPLTPAPYHHESHNISFLKRAIVDQPWAKDPINNINSLNYDFPTFVTALHYSIQSEIELSAAKLESE